MRSSRRGMVAMPDEPASGPALATPPARVIAPMADTECRAVLERQRLCIVSVVDGGEPYAVPVFYGYDGATLYLGTERQRAIEVLIAHNRRVRTSSGVTSAPARRVGGGRVLCVEDASVSGRSFG